VRAINQEALTPVKRPFVVFIKRAICIMENRNANHYGSVQKRSIIIRQKNITAVLINNAVRAIFTISNLNECYQ
jgi:hypothetical protein